MDVIELVEALKTADGETAMELIERLQCGQVDCSAINVSHWAVDNPGLADQMRAESREVRRALAFDPEGEDIAPCDLVEAIEGLRSALSANGGEVEVNSCDGCAAGMPLHHVDPATHRTHMLCTANRYAPPSVAVPDDVTAAPQPDHSPDAGKVVHQCPRCSTSMEVDLAAKPTPTADGGEVEPAFWITPNDFERASNKLNLLCSVTVRGEWRGLVPLYTHPAQPRNEEIAADFEAWLSQVRYMEGLSAHDIIESAEDYITLLRSNGGDV